MAATAVTSFGTSIVEDKIDGNQVDYGKAAVSSLFATAAFGFGKYGADKLTKNVRTNCWSRENTNAFVRYLGRVPTTNVGQVVDRVADVTDFGRGIATDYFFSPLPAISSSTTNSDKPQSAVVV